MRIAIVTDAWDPQVNGVVRTLHALTAELTKRGHEVEVISPCQFRSLPCPSYPEIRLALAGPQAVGERLAAFGPEAIHISTEGPLGWAARRWCLAHGRHFTTAYHTQFPEYLARRSHLPAGVFWPYIRHFHAPSSGIMAATPTLREQLEAHGLTRLRPWGRGVDLEQFGQDIPPPDLFLQLPRPIQLYVGRVAVEKNVEAFLSARHAGSKVVVGDGPALARLQAQFPEVMFLGRQSGRALAACYAGADVFVFPSRTDTFGLVMIEALASGTPVAAYPVPGPIDVLTAESGCLAESLGEAISGALQLDRARCRAHGRSFTWEASTDQFLAALTPECPPQVQRELRAA
ncbi:glycosyltransferase family 4 protein [Altererythrobacter sp. Root672]|uniref:glycosyltransferase family 4 protein n=1 Tax=Altererythrobacter sp. Root672 TaxID=1736584 RepID=UPI0006FB9D43|nr:glycosyltransferase family 1 protein [Altererythrobacter sp. Root672]KRA81522.1 alpha-mannosyltransferase [Altererythrobacter sp. Root672]